jgi:hypothetical protein
MAADRLPAETVPVTPTNRLLTADKFHQLADVPPEVEWFANISNPHTKRAYENAVKDFMRFTGIARPDEFRSVTRAHIIAWRDDLVRRRLGGSTIRPRLASLVSLFEYLCERNAVTHNPGQRRRAARYRIRRRQDAGARRSPGAQTARRAGGRHHQKQARPRRSLDAAVPRVTSRGTVQARTAAGDPLGPPHADCPSCAERRLVPSPISIVLTFIIPAHHEKDDRAWH